MKTRSGYIIAFFALIKLLIPFLLIDSAFELHRDEYLYLADADHLACGYIEMPPLLAVLGYISKLFGGSVYSVYFWGGLTGALTMMLTGMIAVKLRGNTFAVFMACLGFLCTGMLRMHILFQPNFLDVLFWTWASYLIVRWIQTDNKKYLYWLGVCFGLGMLGKYSMGFYIAAFLLAVALTDKRRWLIQPHFYFAMGLGVLICLPNLLWQYSHHFPLMHHMNLLTTRLLKHNTRAGFIEDQLLIAFPAIVIWLGGLLYIFFTQAGRKYIAIGIIYLGIIGILLYFNGKGYYAAAIYPTLMSFGGVWFALLVTKRGFGWSRWVLPALMLLLTIRILPAVLPYRSPESLEHFYQTSVVGKMDVTKWEDQKLHPLPQDFADMLGWKEMAEKTARIYHSLPDSVKARTMVYGDNYGEAGALSFYGKKLGLPQIHSDEASYVFWLPDQFNSRYFLFVCAEMPEEDDCFFQHWGKREILDSVTQRYAREYNTKIILYSQPDDSASIIANQHINESKKQFNFQ